jgi:hypothetical protein
MRRLEPIPLDVAKEIARRKGLKPGRVRTTKSGIQLTKGKNQNVSVISWDEFEADLKERGLAIYHYSGWLKIMRKP